MLRFDLENIANLIKPKSKVLDIGCGNGELLQYLRDEKQVSSRGIEIDVNKVTNALKAGLSVVQGDLNEELGHYPTLAFDYVVVSQTLQVAKRPELVLKELQRIAKFVIVSVPNFGYIENRFFLLAKGKMPVTKTLAYQWYNTPNIHFCTIKDFAIFAKDLDFLIEKQIFINESLPIFKKTESPILGNLFAKYGIFLLSKGIIKKSEGVQEKINKDFIRNYKASTNSARKKV